MASLPLLLSPRPRPNPQTKRNIPPCTRKRRGRTTIKAVRDYGGIEPLYDDGYNKPRGTRDYVEAVWDVVKYDGDSGPPRWFCPVDCGPPVKDAPVLLFLPDISGVGLGLFMHHKALGRIFDVRCMHVPFNDRTPFEGLVKLIEDVLRFEHSIAQTRPIYLIGHCFGGCLALSVAARNPNMDLILILSNPGSQLTTALGSMQNEDLVLEIFNTLSGNILSLLPHIQSLQCRIPLEIISWKLKLLKSAACYCSSRLHAVKAEVLLLASCLDNILHNGDEAKRLKNSLHNSQVLYFKDHGHNLLLENGIKLSFIIKVCGIYRHARRHNYVLDYLPPTMTELEIVDKEFWLLYLATNPVMFSTLENGKIVRGLSGIPNDGPVLLVGNHMFLGVDMFSLIIEFLREKRIVVRGLGHRSLFPTRSGGSLEEQGFSYLAKLFGGVPVSSRNLHSLLSDKSHVLLYPGGTREALHQKGEEYKLFWQVQPEFVRMATQFGATIVPFGTVGEDDLGEFVLDYNDLSSIPIVGKLIEEININFKKFRIDVNGEVQDFFPGLLPKIPGRFYYLFGKPIETRGMKGVTKNRKDANDLYLEIKTEIEGIMSYLKRKREDDPYRNIVQRTLYQASWNFKPDIPSFEP